MTADEDIEVRLVEVDVRVTDKDGEAIRGLSAEDFVLRVDGEEIAVEHFAAGPSGGAPAPQGYGGDDAPAAGASGVGSAELAPVPATGGAPGQNLIVYLDQRFLDEAEMARASTELQRFLRNDLAAGSRVMLASADDSLRVVHTFTREPALVADALQDLEIAPGGGLWRTQYDQTMQEIQRYHDMGSAASSEIVTLERAPTSDSVRDGEFSLDDTNDPRLRTLEQGEDKGPTELVETDPRYSLQMIESFGQTVESGLQASAAHVARLASAAAGLPGDTSVIYVGGTLPVNATRTLFELWQDTYGDLADGGDWMGREARDRGWRSGVAAASLESGDRFSGALDRLGQVADVASSMDIAFHTLDVSSFGRMGRVGGDTANYRSGAELRGSGRSSDTGLAERSDSGATVLADRTGGRTASGRRIERFFAEVSDHLRSGYTLAFPLPPRAEGAADAQQSLYAVDIELRQPRRWGKPRLHYRRKVAPTTLEQEQIQRTVSALALGLDLDDSDDNPLGVEIAAGEARVGDDGGLRVPISVKVPMSNLALVPDRQAHAGRLSIYVAVGDLERGVGLEKAVVPVRIANRDLLTAFGRKVDYRLEVSAPTAAKRLAVTVRDDFRPERSTVTTQLGSLEPAAPAPGPDEARSADESSEGTL